ncbi:MAG TPA: ABC transporter substrate-binding protein [Candidatus Binatia bacterium]|nr:ABC transporter substrate-binding protein [Candidatus Binatia bacterium]
MSLALPFCDAAAQPLEKIRVGMPSFSLSFVAPKVAQAKGFFAAEGLEVELIQMATNVTVVALTTKDIDYSTASGAVLRSAVRGLPVKVVMYFNGKPLHVLVARRDLDGIAELKGRIIGFAGYGDTTEFMLRAILHKANMELEKDVKALGISGSGARLTALLTGKVDAAILPPPYNIEAEAKGYKRLIAAAEVFDSATSGLGVHVEKLKDNPGQVRRMIRALLRTQGFMKENKTASERIIADWLKLDPAAAAASYELYVRGLTPDGLVSDKTLAFDVDRARESLKMAEAVPLDRVADFTLLRQTVKDKR